MNLLFVNNFKGEGVYGIELWMIRCGAALNRLGHAAFLACRPNHPIAEAAGRHGLGIVPYDPGKGLDLPCIFQLRRFLKEQKIQSVCVKTYNDLRNVCLASLGLPVRVFDRRGNMYDIKNNARHFLHMTLLRPRLIVPSQALKNEFSRFWWMPASRIHVLHHGVELARYQDVPPAFPPAERFNAVFVGRLCPDKGIDVLLQAWKALAQYKPPARLLFVGGQEDHDYPAMARELGLEKLVHFAGYQTDVRPWLASARLLVLPSRREGAGFILLEAMASGLPVVATHLECIAEYVQDGETGRLVPPGSAEELSKALHDLIAHPDLAAHMGQKGLQRATQEFSSEISIARLIEILRGP